MSGNPSHGPSGEGSDNREENRRYCSLESSALQHYNNSRTQLLIVYYCWMVFKRRSDRNFHQFSDCTTVSASSLPVQAVSDPCQSGRLGISPVERYVFLVTWGESILFRAEGNDKERDCVKESGLRCDSVQYTTCMYKWMCSKLLCHLSLGILLTFCLSLGHDLLGYYQVLVSTSFHPPWAL